MVFLYSKMFPIRTAAQLLSLTQSELDTIKEDCVKLDKENRESYESDKTKSDALVKELIELHKSNSLLVKYLKKSANVYQNPYRNINSYENLIGKIKKLKEEQEKSERDIQLEKRQTELTQKAIMFLYVRGFTLGKDYNIEEAVEKANDIRFEELKKEAIENGGVEEFNGQNCDDCSGWDGESHRCNCGNRRMAWDFGGNFDNMYVYGEAY